MRLMHLMHFNDTAEECQTPNPKPLARTHDEKEAPCASHDPMSSAINGMVGIAVLWQPPVVFAVVLLWIWGSGYASSAYRGS